MKQALVVGLMAILASTVCVANQAAIDLKHQLQGCTTMRANFKQVIKDHHNHPLQYSSGNMMLKRPGLFRWYTHQPNRQLLVVQGDKLWVYDIDLEQLTINRLDWYSVPAMLLTNLVPDLEKSYTISEKVGKDNHDYWFTLTPKFDQDNFIWIKLLFNESKLLQMNFKDKMGQTFIINFSHIVLNKPLRHSLFQIKPPLGVDVIDNS